MSGNKIKDRVLVAIPVINQLAYTKAAVKSLKMSQPFITLILDNGSTDGTEAWLKSMINTPDFACVRFPQNMGCSTSWNEAIRIGLCQFDCEYIFILNNDLLVKSDTLDLMLEVLKRPDVGLVSAKNVSGSLASPQDLFDLKTPDTAKVTETPDFSCFAVKRKTIEKVGLFDEAIYPAYFEDNDFHYRLKLEKLHGYCVHASVYFHYGSRTAKIDPDFKAYLDARYVKNREYFVRKWGGEPGKEKFTEPFDGNGPRSIDIDDCGYNPAEILKSIQSRVLDKGANA